MASTTDLLPTVLDWFGLTHPTPDLKLTGRSLLALTVNPANIVDYDRVFSSHNLHDVSEASASVLSGGVLRTQKLSSPTSLPQLRT